MAERLRPEGRLTVRAPATSANIGPGFDSFGLCLDVADVVSAEVVDRGTTVDVMGVGAGDLPRDDKHLVVSVIRRLFDEWGMPQPGLRLACHNAIPQARGLGSSAAAIVAGVLLARGLAGSLAPADLDVLGVATSYEGHPDNVAACLLGGLTIAWTEARGPRAVSLAVDSRVQPVVLVADQTLPTELARELLPSKVGLGAASANVARAGLLVVALTDRPELLLPATHDRLHQDGRREAMPETLDLVDSLRAEGLAAVVSGAGPSVLVLCTADRVAGLLDRTRWRVPAWHPMSVAVDRRGAGLLPT